MFFGTNECRKDICFTNNKVDEVNKLWNLKEAPKNCLKIPGKLHSGLMDEWKIYKNMPVISKQATQDSKLFGEMLKNNEDLLSKMYHLRRSYR